MADVIPILFTIIIAVILAGMFVIIVALFLCDLKLLRFQKQQVIHKRRSPGGFTIVVYAQNSEATIADCLDAIYRTYLRSVEVLIVDNGSTDNTVLKIREFQKAHPKFKMLTLFKNRRSEKRVALRQAFKKSHNNGASLCINANIQVNKHIIKRLRTIETPNRPIALQALPLVETNYLLISRSYMELSGYLFHKALYYLKLKNVFQESSAVYYPSKSPELLQLSASTSQETYINQLKYSIAPKSQKVFTVSAAIKILALLASYYLVRLAVSEQVILPLLYTFAIFTSWICFVSFSSPYLSRRERGLLGSTIMVAYPLILIAEAREVLLSNLHCITRRTIRVIN